MSKTGENFKDFFGAVSRGEAGQAVDQPVMRTPFHISPEFEMHYRHMTGGHFDKHIEASIPGYREHQLRTAYAIHGVMQNMGLKNIIDIGGSEGALINTIASTVKDSWAVNMDPSPAMYARHREIALKHKTGSGFKLGALPENFDDHGKQAWVDGDVSIPFERLSKATYHVIHESMTLQFISPNRSRQFESIRYGLVKGGLFLTSQKLIPDHDELSMAEWARREAEKDRYKAQFFPADQIKAKAEEVLVGMSENMVSMTRLADVATEYFKHVAVIWQSCNFYGLACSDDINKIAQFIAHYGPNTFLPSGILTPQFIYR